MYQLDDVATTTRTDAPLTSGPSRVPYLVPDAEDRGPSWLATVCMLVADAVVAAVLLLVTGIAAAEPLGSVAGGLALLVGTLVSRRLADAQLVANKGLLEEVPRIAVLGVVSAFVAAMVVDVADGPVWDGEALLSMACVLGAAAVAGQIITIKVLRHFTPAERCLLVGAREDRAHFLRQLDVAEVRHLQPIAGVDVHRLGRGGDDLPTLELLVDRMMIDRVIVLPGAEPDREAQVARRARNAGARVMVAPRTMAAIGERIRTERIGGSVIVSAERSAMTLGARLLKRSLDLTGALLGLAALGVPMLVLAILIRVTSPGPALFWQDRVGLDGRRFRIAKFRTMVRDAEALKDGLREHNEAGGGLFKMAEDPRITRVGRFLRRTSLDELPQLINVLRGDMSLVGPRPLVDDEDALIEGWLRDRLNLKPGMTGAWQIMGSARIPLDDMVALDHQYVAGWSLWLDVRILLRTVMFVLGRRGM